MIDLRNVDIEIAQLYTDMQLATQDLYNVLTLLSVSDNDSAYQHLQFFSKKLRNIISSTKVLENKMIMVQEAIGFANKTNKE